MIHIYNHPQPRKTKDKLFKTYYNIKRYVDISRAIVYGPKS